MRTHRITMAAGLLLVSMAHFSSAFADDFYCPSEFGYDYETVYGNIIVQEDMDCMLTGTMVYGNVLLYAGSSLTASDVTIDGNIEAYMAKYVRLSSSNMDCMDSSECMTNTVIGDIKIEFSPKYMPVEGMMTEDWGSSVKHSMVDGNIQLYENWSPVELTENYVAGDIQASYNWGDLLITKNTVEGNIQVEENKGRVDIAGNYYVTGDLQAFYNWGGVTIAGNTIEGNLQCKGNDPMPEGSGNMVEGNIEDQCMGFDFMDDSTDDTTTSGGGESGTAADSGTSESTSASTGVSAGGGTSGPLFAILLGVVAILRSRRQRTLAA